MKISIVLLIAFTINSSLLAEWQGTGPGDPYISTIFINGNDVYAGGGPRLYQSNDKGISWKILTGYESAGFEVILDVVSIEDKIFAGTLNGLYVTFDSGDNWEYLGN